MRQTITLYILNVHSILYYMSIIYLNKAGKRKQKKKKNTFESVLMRWMKLEPIIQSEVCQKEKHQYSILMHIYGI